MSPRPARPRPAVLVLLLVAALVAGLIGAAAPAQATPTAPGDLNPGFGGFGNNGLITGGPFNATSLAVQPDGKLIVVGRGSAGGLHVRRYLANGQRDPAFGDAGSATIARPIGMDAIVPLDVAALASGHLVVVGRNTASATTGGSDFLVIRLTPAGQPDTAFGQGGFVLTDFAGDSDGAEAVALQLDGKIVVVGSARVGEDLTDFAVVRYHADGSLDDNSDGDGGFGGDGRVTIAFAAHQAVFGLALQPDGKVVLVGTAIIGNDYDFAVARLEPDGALDDNSDGDGGFSGDGKLTTGFGDDEAAQAVAVQTDGRIVVVGQSNFNADDAGFIARYKANGDLDGTFGSGGKLSFPAELFTDLALQLDGKIVVLGDRLLADADDDLVVRRLTATGAPDPGFAEGAGVIWPDVGGDDRSTALALLPDGRLVILGMSSYAMVLARFGPDGQRHELPGQQVHGLSFPLGYRPGYQEYATGLALQANGDFLVAGQVYAPDFAFSDAFVTRFRPTGQPDGTFGPAGTGSARVTSGVFSAARAVAVQPDGRAVIAGYSAFDAQYAIVDFLVARFTTQGAPAPSFGTGGTTLVDFEGGADTATALALAPGGKLVVAGPVWNGVGYDWGVARLTAAGQPDPTFDSDGEMFVGLGLSNALNAVVVQPDGKILLAGHIGRDFAVVRLDEQGRLDTTFGVAGLALYDLGGTDIIHALALAADGWIYAAGHRVQGGNADLALAQLTPTGQLAACADPAACDRWPTGTLLVDQSGTDYAYALDLRADGQLVAAGCSGQHFAGVQVPTRSAPVPQPFSTDFLGYPDCAKAVKFVGPDQVLMAGDQGLYPFNADSNLALASFQTSAPVAPSAAYRLYLPLVLR